MVTKKKVAKVIVDKMVVEIDNRILKATPVEIWNKIFKTYIEDLQGEHSLVELQQNPETKDIRAVKVAIK